MGINLHRIRPHQQHVFRLCWTAALLSAFLIWPGEQTVVWADTFQASVDFIPAAVSKDDSSFLAGAFLSKDQQKWLHQHIPIRVGVTPIPPQVFRDEQTGKLSGFCIDYLRTIDRLLGEAFEIVYYDTWNAMMDAAVARQVDVIYAAQQTPSRQELFLFTQPYLEFTNKIIMTTDVSGPVSMADLAGRYVAVVEGAAIQEYLQSDHPQMKLIPVDDELTGLLRVSFGQVDAMIIEVSRASWYIQQYKITNLHIVGEAGYPFVLGFSCRNDQPELRDILDASLSQISPEQRQELEAKWVFPEMRTRMVNWRIVYGILIGIVALLASVLLWNILLRRSVKARTFQLQQELAERKRAEASQAESKRRLLMLMDNLQGVAFRCLNRPDWPMEFLSKGCQELTGYPAELFLSCQVAWNDLIVAEDRTFVWGNIQEALGSQQTYQVEYRIITSEGQLKWLWEKGSGITDADGNIVALEGFVSDISHLKDIEEKLRGQEAQLASILKASPVGIGLISNRVFLHINEQVCAMTGYSHEELIGQNTRMLYLTQEDYDYVGREKYRQIKEQGIGTVETRWCRKNGKMITVLLSSTPIDVHDLSKGIIFNALDITEAKTARQMAITERDKAQQYLDIAGVMIVVLDAEGRIKLLNKKGCEILECTESQVRGKDWFTGFLSKSARKITRKAFCDLITGHGDKVEYFENSVVTATGKEKLIAWHNTIIRDEKGEIVGTLSSGLDVMKQRVAERALQFTQFAVDHAGEGAFWTDPEGQLIYINDAACKSLGYTREELLQMTISDLDPNFPEANWSQHWEESKQKGSSRIETLHRTKDGRLIPVEISANYVCYEGIEYHCSFARDISERKAAEEAQQKLMGELQSKNEELESIVFIASHDLRSPLVNIRGFSGELEKSLAQLQHLLAGETLSESAQQQLNDLFNNDIAESIGFINAGNRKMDMLLNGLLRLSRIGTAQVCPAELDMNQLLEGIVNNFRFRTRQTDVEIAVNKEMPTCWGDAVLVNQIFNNLIENAIKYRFPGRPAKIHISAEIKDGTVVYCVQDNGIGIDPEHIDKVFEIFHRLNPDGDQDGEGLGLTIVRRLLKRQAGRVWIDSKPDVGTSVYAELPKKYKDVLGD